jgi:hypothetical protein
MVMTPLGDVIPPIPVVPVIIAAVIIPLIVASVLRIMAGADLPARQATGHDDGGKSRHQRAFEFQIAEFHGIAPSGKFGSMIGTPLLDKEFG